MKKNTEYSDEESDQLNKVENLRKKLSKNYFNYEMKCDKLNNIEINGFREDEIYSIPYYIVNPNSIYKFYFNVLMYFLTFYNLFFIPIDFSFSKKCVFTADLESAFRILDVISCICFSIDILLKFLCLV